MAAEDRKQILKNHLVVGSILVAAGFAISGMSLVQIMATNRPQVAQTTQPLQPSPPEQKEDKPAEAKPGGDRPTTPAPEPARPDPDAQKAGAQPALPPAPAEKTAPPIERK